jgi:hypothetical protein
MSRIIGRGKWNDRIVDRNSGFCLARMARFSENNFS